MYHFIDVNGVSEGNTLPSEALQLNGQYLENQISGYRTLGVSGREALSPELSYYETGIRDGAKLQNKRYPVRIITVTYQLKASSIVAFREAYNMLGRILNVKQAELIFNDEPDKFFVGTPSVIGEVEPGSNAVVGTIEFLCTDPFKYSVLEYEAESSLEDRSILIDYNGTYQAFPTLQAEFYREEDVTETGESQATLTGAGDCGYVAFVNEAEKIIQLGNVEEVDGKDLYPKSQTLMNQTFLTNTAWGTAAKNLWVSNAGTVLPPDIQQMGSVAMGVASYTTPSVPKDTNAKILDNVKTTSSAPLFYYSVTAKATNRAETSVNVTFAIKTSLYSSESYFGIGYGLKGSVYIGGKWHDVTIKKTSEYWKGKGGHDVKPFTIPVTGLTAGTKSLTGIKFKVTRTDSLGTAGTLGETACKNLPLSIYTPSVPERYYLTAGSYGTASGKYHGPSITRTLPKDQAGETGALNFTFTYEHKMCISSSGTNQLGAFQVQLSAATGKNVAGVRILKNKTGKSASLVFYVNGTAVYTGSIDLSYNNKYFGAKESAVNTSTITKSGNKITFSIGGIKKVFTSDAVAAVKVEKVTFMFEQYSDSPALSYNGLYWAKFVKDNCTTYQDIPNKFSANDVVTADCKNGEIRLNGELNHTLGALGNDWEGFHLVPGLNQIGVLYSDWVTDPYAPSFKVRYREVFL